MMSEKVKRANEQVLRLQADLVSERETAAAAEHSRVSSATCGSWCMHFQMSC